jgi:hypothetical protein
MFEPFESVIPSSRIWIYQANQKFTAEQKSVITTHLTEFVERWVAHGHPLRSSFDLRFDQFIILTADESYQATSGCSVDDSVRTIKVIQQSTGLDFFDRNKIAFLRGNEVLVLNLSELKQKYQERIWNEETFTFNNLLQTKSQLENEWIVPAGKTWLKRYVPNEIIAS